MLTLTYLGNGEYVRKILRAQRMSGWLSLGGGRCQESNREQEARGTAVVSCLENPSYDTTFIMYVLQFVFASIVNNKHSILQWLIATNIYFSCLWFHELTRMALSQVADWLVLSP